MSDKIKNFINSDNWAENCEKFTEVFDREYESDSETWRRKGFQVLKAVLEGNADGVLIALCGWSAETLIEKAIERQKEEEE